MRVEDLTLSYCGYEVLGLTFRSVSVVWTPKLFHYPDLYQRPRLDDNQSRYTLSDDDLEGPT